MMKTIILASAFLLTLLFHANSWAGPINDCANNGGTNCSDSNIAAAGVTDTAAYPTSQDQCNAICTNLANRIGGQLSSFWQCTATSATPTGTSVDHNGTESTHCSCDVTCVKGVLPIDKTQVDSDIFPFEGDLEVRDF